MKQLWSRPYQFDFFQAARLLEQAAGTGGELRFQTRAGLAFDASDVLAVSGDPESGIYRLTSNVLSIAGPSGPLPLPYTELLLQLRSRGDGAAAEFLDIFNNRLMAALFHARRRVHPALLDVQADRPAWQVLRALTHLPLDPRSDIGALGPRASALFVMRTRSLAGLQALIAARLDLRVEARSMRGAWMSVDRQCVLGVNALDGQASLGARAWNPAAGITLSLSPRDMFTFSDARREALTPGGQGHRLLALCLRSYARTALEVEVELVPTMDPVARSRLGWSSWLGCASRQRPRFRLRAWDGHASAL